MINIFNGLLEPISKILVGYFGGMQAQGVYELAFKTVLQPRNLLGFAINSTIPSVTALFAESKVELTLLYNATLRFSILYMAITSLILIAIAPGISNIWIGRVDNQYWLYVGLLAIGFAFSAIAAPAFVLGVASGRLIPNFTAISSALLVLIIFGLVLGYLAGGTGVVVALCAAYAINAWVLLRLWNLKRLLLT